jgi:hypothetical protein
LERELLEEAPDGEESFPALGTRGGPGRLTGQESLTGIHLGIVVGVELL